jgi:hypothetical protein
MHTETHQGIVYAKWSMRSIILQWQGLKTRYIIDLEINCQSLCSNKNTSRHTSKVAFGAQHSVGYSTGVHYRAYAVAWL